MKYVVTVINQGQQFWLRGTTWAFRIDRSTKFETLEAARVSAMKAEKFMSPSIRKWYVVEEIPD